MKTIVIVLLIVCARCISMGQVYSGDIIFSRCYGSLQKGGDIDVMYYSIAKDIESKLIEGTVTNRGEYNAVISPKRNNIAFNTYKFGGWKLAIAPLKNGQVSKPQKFSTTGDYEYNLQWSTDESKVVFQVYSWERNDQDIYVAKPDRSEIRNVTNSLGGDRTPSFSPNGDRILFTTGRSGNYEVCEMDLDGKILKNFSSHPAHDFAPSYSPNGDRIAFLSNRSGKCDLYIYDSDSDQIKNITEGKLSAKFTFNNDWSGSASWGYKTSWSPDGDSVVFCLNDGKDLEIFSINLETMSVNQLTDNDYDDFSPFWIK